MGFLVVQASAFRTTTTITGIRIRMSALTSAKHLRCEPCQQLQKINQIKNALVEKSKERFEKQSHEKARQDRVEGERRRSQKGFQQATWARQQAVTWHVKHIQD